MQLLWARCPWCGYTGCDADFNDSAGQLVQTSPFRCLSCLATQVWPGDSLELDAEEARLGWYRPGRLNPRISSLNGTLLTDHQAQLLTRASLAPDAPFQVSLDEDESIRAFELID